MRVLVFAAAMALFTSGAAAQDDTARARALFEEASAAMASGRVAAARDLFSESLTLEPRAATAYNLAVTLRESGDLTEALSTYEALLAGDYGPLEAEKTREVRRAVTAVRRELGRLIIEVDGADEVLLRVDGRALETVSAGSRMEALVNPGDHVVTARAPRSEPAERQIVVESGQSLPISFDLAPPTEAPSSEEEVEDDASLFASPWPWIIFGVVALAGAAVAIAVTAASEPAPEPLPDDLVLGRVMTLSY